MAMARMLATWELLGSLCYYYNYRLQRFYPVSWILRLQWVQYMYCYELDYALCTTTLCIVMSHKLALCRETCQ